MQNCAPRKAADQRSLARLIDGPHPARDDTPQVGVRRYGTGSCSYRSRQGILQTLLAYPYHTANPLVRKAVLSESQTSTPSCGSGATDPFPANHVARSALKRRPSAATIGGTAPTSAQTLSVRGFPRARSTGLLAPHGPPDRRTSSQWYPRAHWPRTIGRGSPTGARYGGRGADEDPRQ